MGWWFRLAFVCAWGGGQPNRASATHIPAERNQGCCGAMHTNALRQLVPSFTHAAACAGWTGTCMQPSMPGVAEDVGVWGAARLDLRHRV